MKRQMKIWAVLAVIAILLAGCGEGRAPESTETTAALPEVSGEESNLADSLDRAVLQTIDLKKNKMTFYNLQKGKSYTLSFDSGTSIKGRFDEELVAAQLEAGDVVMVAFLKDTKYCKTIWLDKSVAKQEALSDFEINRTARWLGVGDTRYAIGENAPVLKDGKLLSLIELNESDTMTVFLDDHTIMSFVITNEHGYVRLEGVEGFIGGFVEFTQNLIRRVDEEMLIVLPSGHYEMLISKDAISGTKSVDVLPGKETVVDVSDLVPEEEIKDGSIIFTITPAGALLQIDGVETDYSEPVTLSYGVHQMIVSLEGYQTITEYIKVGQELANLNVEMEKSSSGSGKSDSVSGNSAPSAVGDGNRVYIDAPVGAELYVEGKYIGLIPTSFEKKAGSYILSIRKSGYATRSYSLELDGSKKDVRYSFSELEVSQ